MPFSITNKAAYQQYKSSLLLSPSWKIYLRWSNTNFHRLWWVQHLLTKPFWFFVNIKIIAKKQQHHHLWHL